MGTKESGYACLELLLNNQSELGAHVVGVLTNARPSLSGAKITVGGLCQKWGVPIIPSLEAYLNINDFDILISVQYHQILKPDHIQKAGQIAVNLHMAPLPEYRGCNQFSFAIIDQVQEFGTTLHTMEAGVDSGAILFERRFPISDNCYAGDLYERTLKETLVLFRSHIGDIIRGDYSPIEQSTLIEKRGTSFHLRKEIDDIKRIDLSWEKEKILRYTRATYFPPFPPPYAISNGERVEITPEWIAANYD